MVAISERTAWSRRVAGGCHITRVRAPSATAIRPCSRRDRRTAEATDGQQQGGTERDPGRVMPCSPAMSVFDELQASNDAFAATFAAGDLPAPPARHLAVLTCMDARILPLAVFGLDPGDAHIVRNAGGRVTDDALRS